MMKHNAWLGLGGNVGDVATAMGKAITALSHHAKIDVQAVSSLYRTPPWGKTDQPDFINCCLALTTTLEPLDLLDLCQLLEQQADRQREQHWGPRTLDVDYLYDASFTQWQDARLTLPHPFMLERAFVLVPLAEIAPQLIINGQAITKQLEKIDHSAIEKIDNNPDWWQSA